MDTPQPADPSKPAAPQSEVADTDVEMKDVESKDASAASSSDRKHVGEMTGSSQNDKISFVTMLLLKSKLIVP